MKIIVSATDRKHEATGWPIVKVIKRGRSKEFGASGELSQFLKETGPIEFSDKPFKDAMKVPSVKETWAELGIYMKTEYKDIYVCNDALKQLGMKRSGTFYYKMKVN